MASYGHKGGYPAKNTDTTRKGQYLENTPVADTVKKKTINVFAPRRAPQTEQPEKKAK